MRQGVTMLIVLAMAWVRRSGRKGPGPQPGARRCLRRRLGSLWQALGRALRHLLMGRAFMLSLERNRAAAEGLDRVLKAMLEP